MLNNEELKSFLKEKQHLANCLFDSLLRDVNLEFVNSMPQRLRTLNSIMLDVNSRMDEFLQKTAKKNLMN